MYIYPTPTHPHSTILQQTKQSRLFDYIDKQCSHTTIDYFLSISTRKNWNNREVEREKEGMARKCNGGGWANIIHHNQLPLQ